MASRVVISFFIFCLVYNKSFGGGWPQPKGSYYIKLSEWWIVSDQHFDDHGDIQANIFDFGYYSTALYAGIGLTDRLTGIVYFPFLNYTYAIPPSMTGKQSVWALGDLDIALKFALTYQKPLALSVTLLSGIPLGIDRENSIGGLQTGDGEWNQAVILDSGVGYPLFKSTGWTNIYGGFNHRAESFADEILYGIESGVNLADLTFIFRFAGVKALGDSEISTQKNPQSLFSNFKEYFSFSPEVAYHINSSLGITLGAGTALSGKNIFANPTFTIGVFNRYNKPPQQ